MSYKNFLQLKRSKSSGLGVFTSVNIPSNKVILEFKGDLYNRDSLIHDASQILQVGPDLFLGPSGDIDDYVNHSCDPNCFLYIVGNRAFLYSLYLIPKDTELFFDYSTSSTDTKNQWKMECKCGSFNCRKIISGFQYLDDVLKKQYKDQQMIPLFLQGNIFR